MNALNVLREHIFPDEAFRAVEALELLPVVALHVELEQTGAFEVGVANFTNQLFCVLQLVGFSGSFRCEFLGANATGNFGRLEVNAGVTFQMMLVIECFRAQLAG